MTTVSVKEARSTISSLLDKAAKGEEIIITRRGERIARITGIPRARPRLPSLDALRKSVKVSGTSMSKTVIKNRAEERY